MVEGSKKTNVEEQLAQYRMRKKREEEYAALKQKIWGYLAAVFTFWRPEDGGPGTHTSPGSPEAEMQDDSSRPAINTGNARRRKVNMGEATTTMEEEEASPTHYTRLDLAMLFLKILMWLLLQKVFILLEFGAVFFIASAFLFIWYNLRNEPKKKGEASAYSVFNPNCEAIDGTFTAEQFERELLHKM
uniref:SAYSvFN domain-containing protein n=1 Tax=Scylla olivacea TaxID=85551 RepID=A0A0P4W6K8_SCYOL